MKFNLSKEQKAAIYKVAEMMANADGIVRPEEITGIEHALPLLGIADIKAAEMESKNMPPLESLNIISKLEQEVKKYVSACLGYVLSIDGDIDDSELALWRFLSELCDLPKMTNRQAISLLQ